MHIVFGKILFEQPLCKMARAFMHNYVRLTHSDLCQPNGKILGALTKQFRSATLVKLT